MLLDELEAIGYRGDHPAEPAEPYDSYLELHVEQGPYLAERGADVGVVTGIVGTSWGAVTFEGEADHSGPTPMHTRSDALVAAADFVTAVRRLPGTLGERTVATTGSLAVEPDSINIIPEEVTATWDVRDPDDPVIEEAIERLLAEAESAADREGVDWRWEERMRTEPVDFPDRVVEAVADAADDAGYETTRLVSGAGHDAMYAASVCDTGMVFAVSENGKSHTPEEFTSDEDCYRAADTYARAALSLAEPVE